MESYKKNLRAPPPIEPSVDPENEGDLLLEDWPEVREALMYFYDQRNRKFLSKKEKSLILKNIISPDERERKLASKLVEDMLLENEIDRGDLINILVEFLLDKIGHHGIDLVIYILSESCFAQHEIVEVCIPLLTKNLTYSIRCEVLHGVLEGSSRFDKEMAECILGTIHRLCRSFPSKECILAIEIMEEIVAAQAFLELSSVSSICKILNILLSHENQFCIKRICSFLDNERVGKLLEEHGYYVVPELFTVVYSLSQRYWKKTEQAIVCEILQKLFLIDKDSFDVSLREYNMQRYTIKESHLVG